MILPSTVSPRSTCGPFLVNFWLPTCTPLYLQVNRYRRHQLLFSDSTGTSSLASGSNSESRRTDIDYEGLPIDGACMAIAELGGGG